MMLHLSIGLLDDAASKRSISVVTSWSIHSGVDLLSAAILSSKEGGHFLGFISLLVWVKKPPEAAEQRGVFTPSKLHEES